MILSLALTMSSGWAFGPDPVTTIVGDTPHATPYGSGVAVADVDGDGYDDVLLAYIGGVDLHEGGPAGVDAVASWSRVLPTTQLGEGATLQRVGDVNGDGYDDVAIAFAGPDQVDSFVELWLGSPTGLGAVPDAVLEGPVGVGGFGEQLAAADVDRDGFDDLIVVTPRTEGGQVEVFRGSAAGLRGPRVVARGSDTNAVAGPVSVGDHDGDGHADLLVAVEGTAAAYLLRGDGTGRFAARPVEAPSDHSHLPAFADLDGDGRDEVVLAGPSLWVHGGGSGAMGPALEVPVSAGHFEPVDVAGPYDVDGDGLDDLVFAGAYSLVTLLGDASGTPLASVHEPAGSTFEELLGPIPFLEVDLGDVDGDGATDYVSESYWGLGARVTYGGTDPSDATFWSGLAGSVLYAPSNAGDVDGDGIDDVRGSTGQVFLGSPTGLTDVSVSVPLSPPVGLELDADGNGVPDTVDWEDGLAWYRDREADGAPDVFLPAPQGVTRAELAVGDADGDGHDDVFILATDDPDGVLYWVPGTSSGPAGPVVLPDGAYGDDPVMCADSDGDGRCELLLRRDDGSYVTLPGTASGPGAAAPLDGLDFVQDGRDYNGDGIVDLIGWSDLGSVAMYGGPSGWVGASTTVFSELGRGPRSLGDVDGDGFEDVVVYAQLPMDRSEVRVHYGSNAGLELVPSTVLAGSTATGFASGAAAVDVDGDGVKELVVGAFAYDSGRGALHVYEP